MLISAIIPAYNEENTIMGVIDVLKKAENIDEIIVVSDGSRDKTAVSAEKCGVKVIRLTENMGKGAAIKAGLENCSGEYILFLDADLIGLTTKHINKLLEPILNNDADMTVGIFNNGRFSTDLHHRISPYLSGQRVVKRTILDGISNLEITGYGIEIALTKYVEKENIKVKEVILDDLTHVMKEEKFGLIRGFGQRLRMYWEVYREARFARR